MRFSNRFFAVFSRFLRARPISALRSLPSIRNCRFKDGYVLEEQEPRKKLQVGSLTKIATASVVLDWAEQKSGDLNQLVTIPQEAFVGIVENNIGFQPGDSITLRDLLYAALVQSDNIAAYTLAHHVGSKLGSFLPGDVSSKLTPADAFVAQINARGQTAQDGAHPFCQSTWIDKNVRPMPYSTAEDMARLTRYAMNKASFRFYVSQKERQNFIRSRRPPP